MLLLLLLLLLHFFLFTAAGAAAGCDYYDCPVKHGGWLRPSRLWGIVMIYGLFPPELQIERERHSEIERDRQSLALVLRSVAGRYLYMWLTCVRDVPANNNNNNLLDL